MTPLTPAPLHTQPRQALDFDCGVRAYPPTHPDGYWRLRWMEADRRRETTATSKDEVLAKAADVVERLAQGRPTDWAQAEGEALVAHYLDPTRRPARGRAWSLRHREEEQAYCERFVTPVIAHVELARLSRVHFARILAQAPTASVAAHLRRCCSAMVAAGLEEGLLLARQDVLRGVRWSPPAGQAPTDDDAPGRFIDEADIPTATAVAAWRQRRGSTRGCGGGSCRCWSWPTRGCAGADGRPHRRSGGRLRATRRGGSPGGGDPPPAVPGAAADLAPMVERRLAEVAPDALVFPSPRGQWPRRSNYRCNAFNPAATAAGWPRTPAGRWAWSFHSLRHVFATWALAQPGARIEDVSRLLGHSTVRVTQDLYISPDGDLHERFYRATA